MTKELKKPANRRDFLKKSVLVGTAATAGLAMPHVRNASAAATTTWKIQTSWPGGIGLQIFKDWCGSIKEKTGGQLEFIPFGAKDVVGDFQLFDALQTEIGPVFVFKPAFWALHFLLPF